MLNNLVALLDSGVAPSTNSYESIATQTFSSAGGGFSFTSIPSTYKHLQVRAIARIDGGSSNYNSIFNMGFNNDTAANYSNHQLYGVGSGSGGAGVQTGANPTSAIWSETGSAQFAAHVIDILDYADTNKYKTARALVGTDTNGGGVIELVSGSWRSTSAINRIDFSFNGGGNFAAGSHFALYGIKG